MFRLFDRDDLKLIPAVQSTVPLPELELCCAAATPPPPGSSASGRRACVDRGQRAAARPGAVLQPARPARATMRDARRGSRAGRALRRPSVVRRTGGQSVGGRICATAGRVVGPGRHDDRPIRAPTGPAACRARVRNASPNAAGISPDRPANSGSIGALRALVGEFHRRLQAEIARTRPDAAVPGRDEYVRPAGSAVPAGRAYRRIAGSMTCCGPSACTRPPRAMPRGSGFSGHSGFNRLAHSPPRRLTWK